MLDAALMFSATFRKRVERVARDILTDPLRVVQGDAGEVVIYLFIYLFVFIHRWLVCRVLEALLLMPR